MVFYFLKGRELTTLRTSLAQSCREVKHDPAVHWRPEHRSASNLGRRYPYPPVPQPLSLLCASHVFVSFLLCKVCGGEQSRQYLPALPHLPSYPSSRPSLYPLPPAHHVVIVRVSVVCGLARGIRLCCVTDLLQPQACSAARNSLLCWTQHCCSRKGKYSSTKCSSKQNPCLLP